MDSGQTPDARTRASNTLADLDLEQKIGQMIFVGFPGAECRPEIEHLMRCCHVGGVMLTDRNIQSPAQTLSLLLALQAVSAGDTGLGLFVAVDQEGGHVSRLREPATVLPTSMAIAATGSVANAERCAQICVWELRSVGVNVNFAPVLDVNSDVSNPVIGIRSYGDSPELPTVFGKASIETYQKNGILATAKHFPGHGDTCVDSHLALPTICRDSEALHSTDLPPFEAAIKSGVAMIMTTHAAFPLLGEPERPATLSRKIVTGLLREGMGFDGIVITDALVMDAIASRTGLGEASVGAIEAGADVVLMLSTLDNQRCAYEELVAAVKSGRLSEARIDQSVSRILAAKARLGRVQPPPDGTEFADWPVKRHRQIARDIARKSITVLRNRDQLMPIGRLGGKRLGVIEFAQHRFSPVEDSRRESGGLSSLVLARHPDAASAVLDAVQSNGTAVVSKVVEESDFIVIATRNAHLMESQAGLVRRLIAVGKPTVVVALRNPYDLIAFPDAGCYVASYGDSPCQVEAACDLLFGDFEPSGRLPVVLPGLFTRGYGLQGF